jgi:CRP-like cAMP-binding protein
LNNKASKTSNMKILTRHLEEIKLLEPSKIGIILNRFHSMNLSKNEMFLEAGTICNSIAFLEEGIMCSFQYNEKGEELVKYFLQSGDFFTDMESYSKAVSSRLNIIALCPARIFYIHKSTNEEIQKDIPEWRDALNVLAANSLNKMIQSQHFLHYNTAEEKYRYFIKNYKELALRVPLKYIASYIGITQSSLSRIRRDTE